MVIFFSANIHQRALISGWYFSKQSVKNKNKNKQQQQQKKRKKKKKEKKEKKNRPFFKSKFGDGHLLEHGRLLEFLRYVVVRTFRESHIYLSCLQTALLHRFYLHRCKVKRVKSNSLSTRALLE